MFYVGVLVEPPALATSTCPSASPTDNSPDDAALRSCLNQGGSVLLDPGSPGYLLTQGLSITQSGTTLGSTSATSNATLLAGGTLAAPLLSITNSLVHSTTIADITFDGNRPNRSVTGCAGDRTNESTIVMTTANALDFERNVVTRTVCGAAMRVAGTTMTIAFNDFVDNGHGTESPDAAEPWADGMTLAYCADGDVHDNDITDATDVGIVLFNSSNCNVHANTIQQVSRHAFAGAQFGTPSSLADGFHSGSHIQTNTIIGNGKLSFGVSYGAEPWFNRIAHNGDVSGNTISGAVVNLLVDGVQGGNIGVNTLSTPGPAGSCLGASRAATNYDMHLAHATSTVSTSVPTAFQSYDGCIP